MKVAVCYDKNTGSICSDFEKTKHFNFYDIDNNSVVCSEIVGTMDTDTDQLVHLLLMFETDAVICDMLSYNTYDLLSEEGVTVFSGCRGNADDLIEQMLSGDLISE